MTSTRPTSKPVCGFRGGGNRPVRSIWRAAPVLLFLITWAAYWNSLRGVFVYDDVNAIRDNPYLGRLWPLAHAVSFPLWKRGIALAGRPVAALSFSLNTVLLGRSPASYRTVNILIHFVSGLLLFGIVRRLLRMAGGCNDPERATVLAFFSAALWLAHPLGTAAVTYIVQRCQSLMAFFYLFVLYFCLRGFELSCCDGANRDKKIARWWFSAAVAACALGMGTKESMFTAPVLVYLYDAILVSRSFRDALRQRWFLYVGLAATWIISLTLFLSTVGEKAVELQVLSPVQYLMTQAGVILHYLRLSLWPHPLVVNYNWPAASSLRDVVPQGLVILALLTATAVATVRRNWYGLLGCWFFLILAPTSSIIPIPEPIHEQHPYLSLAAVTTLATLAGGKVYERLEERACGRLARLIPFLGVVVVVALVWRTYVRNTDYYSAERLWRSNVRYRPGSYIAHNGLGVALLEQGRLREAEDCFRESLSQAARSGRPYATGHVNLGNVLMMTSRWDEAQRELEAALRLVQAVGPLHPAAAITLNSLASICIRRKDWAGARTYYQQSLAVDPERPSTYSGLAVALAHMGEFDTALHHARHALEMHGLLGKSRETYEAYDALGRILMIRRGAGDLDEALRMFQQAAQLEPRSDGVQNNLGNALFLVGRLSEAVTCYRKAVDLNPLNAEAWHNLGQALKRQDDLRAAESAFREATRLNPTYAEAVHSLGLLLLQVGRLEEAQPYLEKTVALAPGWDVGWNNLGLLLLNLARKPETEPGKARHLLERAAESFRRSLALNEKNGFAYNAHTNLGTCLLAQGDAKGAIEHHLRALALKPDSPVIFNNLAEAYAAAGEFARAMEAVGRAAQLVGPADASLAEKIRNNLERFRVMAGKEKSGPD